MAIKRIVDGVRSALRTKGQFALNREILSAKREIARWEAAEHRTETKFGYNKGMAKTRANIATKRIARIRELCAEDAFWNGVDLQPSRVNEAVFFLIVPKSVQWKDVPPELWIFKDCLFWLSGKTTLCSKKEKTLLIQEHYDTALQKLERLSHRFNEANRHEARSERPRIPEQIRIAVWKRDSGCCSRCGSRERLEYDHIIPLSKGGSNTVRNIELLCEICNRSKGGRIQ